MPFNMPAPLVVGFAIYLVMSGVTYVAYAIDKSRARHGSRRISENTLHLLELVGGWPGALAAQRVLRHKNNKPSFLIVFWLIVLVHLGVGAVSFFRYGR